MLNKVFINFFIFSSPSTYVNKDENKDIIEKGYIILKFKK